MDDSTWMKILCFPTTTVELVRTIYNDCPRLSGPMVEGLVQSRNPQNQEIVTFLASKNWFRMEGKDTYEKFVGTSSDTPPRVLRSPA